MQTGRFHEHYEFLMFGGRNAHDAAPRYWAPRTIKIVFPCAELPDLRRLSRSFALPESRKAISSDRFSHCLDLSVNTPVIGGPAVGNGSGRLNVQVALGGGVKSERIPSSPEHSRPIERSC